LADRQQAGGQFASGQQTGKYPMLPPGGMMPDGKGGGTAPKQPNARENGGAFDGGGFSDPLAENQEANSADSAATAKGQPAKQPESVEGQAGESTLGEQGFAGSLAAQAGQGPPASISREATDFQANASPQGNASNSANASAASAAASSSNATSASPSMAGARQASQGAASQSAPPSTMQSPSPSMSATIANQVKRQGVDWALPSNVALAHGNDIVRSIRLRVYPDHLVLLPGGRTKAQQVFAVQEGDFNAATLQMATAVRDRIQKWGAAIPGGRWAPRLSVEVAPGGEANYARLERLMSGSGIPLELRSSTRISDGEDAAGRSTKQGSVR
jgi:hypothetical protein